MGDVAQLYGTLILTVLGFIVPVLTILISLFPDGTKSIAIRYENERKQSEENIRGEIEKIELGTLDYKTIKKTLKILEKKKNQAEVKLRYLKPLQFILRTSIPFVFAFFSFLAVLLISSKLLISVLLIISGISLIIGSIALFRSVTVIFEASEAVSQSKKSTEEKIIELLSILVEKSGETPYLKENDVRISLNRSFLSTNSDLNFSVNTKHQILVAIHNSSEKMAKKVEIGLIFPKEVVIEKTNSVTSIYADDTTQIVRFNREEIQAHEQYQQGNLNITFLTAGHINVEVFIKGENVKYYRFKTRFNIVK